MARCPMADDWFGDALDVIKENFALASDLPLAGSNRGSSERARRFGLTPARR